MCFGGGKEEGLNPGSGRYEMELHSPEEPRDQGHEKEGREELFEGFHVSNSLPSLAETPP